MMMSQILPEKRYTFKPLSRKEVVNAYEQGQTVTGYVEKICPKEEELLVRLGDELVAHLPFSEATIYPLHYSENPNRLIPVNICTLLHKNIRVKVTEVTPGYIQLSRKKNMEEAFEYLTTCTSAMFYTTNLTVLNAFGDIGDGIIGILNIREACKARIKNIGELICKGDTLRVILLSHNDSKNFTVSYKQTFKDFAPEDFPEGMAVRGVINVPVDEMFSAFFVTISPQISGIMDALSWHPEFHYGDKVECEVTKSYEKGIKLKFLRLLK